MTEPKPTGKYDQLGALTKGAKPSKPANASEGSDVLAEALEAAKANRPPPKPPKAEHGRRAAGYVQLNLTVRPEVKARLRAAAAREGLTMAEALDHLLDRVLPPA